MEEKLAILSFLLAAGFKENGKDQYFKDGVGRLFIREWNASEVLRQILSLGQQHHAKLLGDLIIYEPHSEFNPQA